MSEGPNLNTGQIDGNNDNISPHDRPKNVNGSRGRPFQRRQIGTYRIHQRVQNNNQPIEPLMNIQHGRGTNNQRNRGQRGNGNQRRNGPDQNEAMSNNWRDGRNRSQGYEDEVKNQPRGGHFRGNNQPVASRGGFRGNFQPRGNNHANREHSQGKPFQANNQPKDRVLNLHKLRAMVHSEQEVSELMLDKNGFSQALNNQDLYSNTEAFQDIVLIILKALDFDVKPNESIILLIKVKSSSFFAEGFSKYYSKLMSKNDSLVNELTKTAFLNSLNLLKLLVEKFPSSLEHIFSPYSMAKLIIEQHDNLFDEEVKTIIEDLKVFIESAKQRQVEVESTRCDKIFQPPSENFREMGIFPDFNRDIAWTLEGPYLRPIITNGGFDDVEHYLDVHFRLLREDFVGQLRKGIREYLKIADNHNIKKPRLNEVRIYGGVQVLNALCHRTGLVHKIKFNNDNLRKVNWMTSKRFIYGSLLCLSSNKFEDVILATVEDRKPKDLADGYLYVKFEDESKVLGIEAADSFVMLETTAFFESYRYVLEALISLNEEKFPFQDVIVKCLPVKKTPNYFNRFGGVFDLTTVEKAKKKVKILDETSWPTAECLGLDEAQLKALQNSLMSEVSVVQGPPGTGKTFLGLKIVEILLDNWKCWNIDDKPILVVCYTNHALDQFLEGISKFLKKGIVRVGGRCKSEALKAFNLNQLRFSSRKERQIPHEIYRRKRDILAEMQTAQAKIESAGSFFEIIDKGLIHENYLKNVMTEMQFFSLCSVPLYDGNSHIAMWLQIHNNEAMPDENNKETTQQQDSEDENIEVENEADLEEHRRRMDMDLHLKFRNLDIEANRKKYLRDAKRQLAVNLEDMKQCDKDDQEWQTQKRQRKNNVKKLKRTLMNSDAMYQHEAEAVVNVWNLKQLDKWRLYRYWIQKQMINIKLSISEVGQLYNKLAETLKKSESVEDEWIMREAKIIGMTTTGAARCRSLLNSLGPKVVIVEEAAEVLESHVIASIGSECQHLILIGDHKQLRPSANSYQLGTKFNLNCSLFERLVKNDYPFATLEKQHRMRPQIADFARITYPQLRDDDSVMHYDDIKGVHSNIFFLNHHELEREDNELMSATNTHEATFLARFCQYLKQQGYSNEQITILTPYAGQMFEIKKFMPLNIFQGLRICPVDNYQGEENDIILLSLVRSNDHGKIGFLKEDNRLNVALTRAKKGLYVIGNFDMLKNKSDFVSRIYTSATQRPSPILGMKMKLCCQNHPNTNISVSHAKDFDSAPEGGCTLPCRFRLKCGHTCTRICHPYDKDHAEFKCLKECQTIMKSCQHKCTKKCFETCGKCEVKVLKVVIRCGHAQLMNCHEDPTKFVCRDKCEVILSCGHPCKRSCGEAHTDQCTVQVTKTLGCGHQTRVPCFRSDNDGIECFTKCRDTLECGHICTGTCGKCFGGRVHVRCTKKCNRSLICGHKCRSDCSDECPLCEIKCEIKCSHNDCGKKCGEECDPCKEKCTWNCVHHYCSRLCHEVCDRVRCDNPCPKKLECGHPCVGLCGEKCPSLCRICHAKVLTEIFFGTEDEKDARFIQLMDCSHVLEVSGLDSWVSNSSSSNEIVALSCPKCKTPIQNNNRYKPEIKSIQSKIEKVKSKMRGSKEDLEKKRRDIITATWKTDLDESMDIIEKVEDKNISLNELTIIECAVKLLSHLNKIQSKFSKIEQQAFAKLEERLLKNLRMLSRQEMKEIEFEITRMELMKAFKDIQSKVETQSHQLTDKDKEMYYDALKRLEKDKLNETAEDQFRTLLKKISPLLGCLGISEVERIQILGALLDVKTGAWFECPNGHVYAIGDCGGATMQGQCNECGAAIGGGSHALRTDNRWNRAMDHARATAWPGTAMNPNP